MRFVLYTEMSVAQCLRGLNDRIEAKGTKSRSEINGWVDKKGAFSITVKGPVFAGIQRTTRMNARLEREKGVTIIDGSVPDGVSPYWMRILGIVMLLLIAGFIYSGNPIYALVVLLFALIGYIPMRGDYNNSDLLLIEIERIMKASPRPPKR